MSKTGAHDQRGGTDQRSRYWSAEIQQHPSVHDVRRRKADFVPLHRRYRQNQRLPTAESPTWHESRSTLQSLRLNTAKTSQGSQILYCSIQIRNQQERELTEN